ncbi:MAG: hypothetical protein WAW77_14370 [Caldibacillus thermoamylovorans]
MKKFGLFLVGLIVIMFIGVLLAGCSSKSNSAGLSDFVTLDELNDFMEDGTGFIFVTSESFDEYYQEQIRPVESALKENNDSAVTFNVYMKDGKRFEDKDINPYNSDELKINALNYIKDGQLVDAFQLSKYDGNDLQQALNDFVKKYKND